MGQKNKVLVKINGQEYPIVGAEAKEYLLKVGSFVDDNMEAVAKANKKLSTSMVAVLTCINITDQFLKMKNNFEELKKEMQLPQVEIDELEKYIETLHGQLKEKDEAYLNLEKKIEEIELQQQEDERIKTLNDQLLEKEDDLQKAQILINDLQNKLFDNQIKLVQATKELEEYMMKNDLKKNNRDFRGK